jgi:hypothetical protein
MDSIQNHLKPKVKEETEEEKIDIENLTCYLMRSVVDAL